MPLFQKKPVIIEARKFETDNDDGTCLDSLVEWINSNSIKTNPKQKFKNRYKLPSYHDNTDLYIETLEGIMQATCGDWIIKGVKGEFYPCKPDIFEQTYKKLEE